MYQVDEDERRKVLQTFGKSEAAANEDVQNVIKWMETQTHFPEIMGATEVLNFLQLNKFDIKKTKDKIDSYYTIRSKIPDFFTDSNPKLPTMQHLFQISYLFSHPKTFEGTSRVLFIKMKNSNTFNFLQMVKFCFNIFEVRLHEDCMVTDTFIMDMENITFKDALTVTPRLAYKALSVYKKVFSVRLKAMYLLNCPTYVSVWMIILKFLMKQKLFDRINVHRDAEIMKKLYSNTDLPKEYGGCGPSLEELTDHMKQKLEQYQDRFDKLDEMISFNGTQK